MKHFKQLSQCKWFVSRTETPIESVENFEPGFSVPKYQGGGAGLRITRPQSCTTAEGGTNRQFCCTLKGEVFPHSWEDINLEIHCSQMLRTFCQNLSIISHRCVLLHSNYKHCPKITLAVLWLYHTAFTNKIDLHWKKSNIFLLVCKLRNQSQSSPRNVNKTARKSLKF